MVNQIDEDRSLSSGSSAAEEFAAHYRDAYRKLTCIAAGVLGRFEDAEDMVQMAASIAIDKKELFESGSHFVAWLCSAVRNCALNHRRKIAGRKTRPADPTLLSTVPDKPDHPEPGDTVITKTGELIPGQHAFDDRVLNALQSLSDESRSCLLLRVILNLSYSELASLMQIPEGTAMSHVHRGKKKMREILGAGRDGKGGDA